MGSTPRKCQFYQRSPKGQSSVPSCLSYNNAAKLQSYLTALQEWAQKWQMKFNPSKCQVLRISRKQNLVESNYVLMGKVLDSVTHHPYLGVELSRNLNWSQHVNNKVMKANRSLGCLWRNLSGCPYGVKEEVYKGPCAASRRIHQLSLGPALKKRTRQTNRGSTKRSRALRQKLLYAETRNSYQPLERVKLDTAKGTKNNLTVNLIFHKAIHGDGGLAFPDYVMKCWRHLRNSSQNKFIELLSNTETYYFCRTVKDWNTLPSEIVNIKSADRLKKVLFEHLSQWWILTLYNN